MYNYFCALDIWIKEGGGNSPWELSWRNFQEDGSVGDVRGKCPDTVAPEWDKRNLVTLTQARVVNFWKV